MILLLLAACGAGGPPDPRAALRATFAASGSVPDRALVEERVLLGQLPAACNGARARLATADAEEDWQLLLRTRARLGAAGGACLPDADAEALSTWAEGRPGWRGARAEWLAAAGRVPEAEALLAAPGDDVARFRVLLAKGDGDAARVAAEGALVEAPRDVAACRFLAVEALLADDPAWALELAACGGIGERAPELLRLAGEALDLAGETSAAEATYARAGAAVHRAALLYQENPTPERRAEAAHLLAPAGDGPRPPAAALHATWMALQDGRPAPIEELDGSVPAMVARALARGAPEDVEALEKAASAPTAVTRARLASEAGDVPAMEAALADALKAAPAAEPVHRARVALRLGTNGDVAAALADWAAQDPDHVAMVGTRGSRDVPWAVVVPEKWETLAARHPDPRMRADAPSGSDDVGQRVRAARALPDAGARADALGALAQAVPGLDAIAAERYRLGPPPTGVPDRSP